MPPQPVTEIPAPPPETAHQASCLLDQQFPWLAAAFTRRPSYRSQLTDLLGRPQGATLEQIMQITGWDRQRAGWFRNYLAPGTRVISRSVTGGTRCYFLASQLAWKIEPRLADFPRSRGTRCSA